MKSLSITLLVTFLISLTFFSFKSKIHVEDDEDYDTLNFQSMNVSGIKLGANYGVILEKLGTPDSVRKEETPDAQTANHFEMYLYGKDAFFVVDENVSGFELITPKYNIQNLGGLKIGDPMNKVKKRFPKSYKLRDVDNTVDDWVTTVSVQFGVSDSFLEITVQNDKVVGLATVTDDGTEE
ncbi:MAG: hypothetical protein RLZZ306_2894 [Bacteroidota bacterium]|jgi:hypothetical protein